MTPRRDDASTGAAGGGRGPSTAGRTGLVGAPIHPSYSDSKLLIEALAADTGVRW
ncbi:hypothetical protein ACRAWC_21130 [Leifsonia sp. L25]|uniref:hypothetical protein n=1 Tax=Leifsonia sp. L25 TaxID=3423957 RepID=UPI003D693478